MMDVWRSLGALVALVVVTNVHSHGSVSMEEDKCKLRVGKYLMHFTGYQPETPSGPKEFCEDIPEPANTVIVLDYINDELRDLPTEVRIVRDTGNASSSDQVRDADTVLYLPFKRHPSGSLSFETKFDAGNYVGLVTVGEKDKIVARFPFSVGKKPHSWHVLVIGVLLGVVGLYYFGMRQRRRQRIAG